MSLSYSPIRRKEEVMDCDRTEEKQPLGHFTPLMILCCALLHPKYLSWASAYSNLIYSDFKTSRQCMFPGFMYKIKSVPTSGQFA